jgi:single-strand DNA-binding protein
MLNKAILIGHVGTDPEIITTQNGNKLAKFSLATSERWKDKNTGEKKEATEWHRVVAFNDGLVGVIEKYVKKGSKLYVEGSINTQKWQDEAGNDRYSTDIQVRMRGQIILLDSKGKSDHNEPPSETYEQSGDVGEDIPF